MWNCRGAARQIVKTARCAIGLVGLERVALGSDCDGAVEVAFDAGELGVLTEEMLKQGFTEGEIRKLMGENMRDFLLAQLPRS
ncbi:Membrane dipeptidase (Peptidase family M19) [Microbulbifer donghaiensis]|uniref:Membrane dipeptidase (Peptidase family M19) n=1 Tax=Microbulbifer donghaiensis TaxID=494016 RepID=A0A1M4VZ65_9GAMM|nr:membrane dipeptidase [Microbulbifer donghaiensis]SHE74163.1 Membrane dipeptidase (Peptidase family M19) [Microbulbifer donghaiensis]